MSKYEYKPCEQCIYCSGYFASSNGIENECMYDRLQGLVEDEDDFGFYFTAEYMDCKDRNKDGNCCRYDELALDEKIGINIRHSLEDVRKKFSLSYWLFGDL